MSVIVCRICLSYDVRMYSLLNSPLQQIYERLTNVPLQTKDGHPTAVCYICHHQLKKCHKFILKSARSDEMFSLLIRSGVEVTGSTLDIVRKQSRDLSWCLKMTPIEYISSPDTEVQNEVAVRVEVVKIEEDTSDQPEHGEEETEVGDEAEVVKLEQDTFGYPEHGQEETEVRDEAEIVKIEEDTFDQPEDAEEDEEEEMEVRDEAEIVKIEEDTFDQLEDADEDEEEDSTTLLVDLLDHSSPDSEVDISQTYILISTRRDVGIGNKICDKVKNNEEIPTYKLHKASLILTKDKDTFITQEKPQNEPIIEEKADKEENYIVMINKKAIQRNVDTDAQKERVLVQKNKPYECEICKKRFLRNGDFKKHYRTHTKEKPYECEICKKRFTVNSSLKVHYRVHNKEKPYECDVCKKRFTVSNNLKIHYRIHNKEKPYECEICNKRFTVSSTLKVHYQIHNNVKPYECKICNKRFPRNDNLKNHYRVHNKEKPYECEICKKRFALKTTLKVHYRIHNKEKPYECEMCKKRFSISSNLKKHYRIHR